MLATPTPTSLPGASISSGSGSTGTNPWQLLGSPSSLGSYYGQYTNPAPAQPYQAPAGQATINTGLNLQAPTLPPGALESLMTRPQTNFAGSFGQRGSYGGAGGFLNNLYNGALYAQNLRGGNSLANLFNSNNAQNNFNLSNAQGDLALRGMGLAGNELGFGLGQQLDYSNLMRNFLGSILGNAMSMGGV
ncbi:MAG: hypothetical protein KGL39_29290 [Patescibacteria group bacterium]|nr:hypothetical protein [Patescibacteria group bacterium]